MTSTTLIAEVGQTPYAHVFGGDSWKLVAPPGSGAAPALVLTLDPTDKRLELDWHPGHLPLASRLDGAIPKRQSYVVHQDSQTLSFEGPPWRTTIDEASTLPNPLPERPLRLRPMKGDENPATAPTKYEVQDTFLGGTGFLRIGGDPLWLLRPERVECSCGRGMTFLACVGYEQYDKPSGLIAPGVPFFLGELALYFFGCRPCARVLVVSQAT
jgi:hypothetical protein